MENKRHSGKVSIWFGNITWIHIHAKFEDLINTSTVTSNTSFEQRRVFHQDCQSFGSEKYCQDIWGIGTHYTKRCKALLVTSKYVKNLVKFLLIKVTDS